MRLLKCRKAAFLVVALAFLGCGNDKAKQSHFDARGSLSDRADTVITLQRTACNMGCPVYTVVIHGDGRVQYHGERYVKLIGDDSARVSVDSLRELLYDICVSGFFELKNPYVTAGTDVSSTVLTVKMGRKLNHIWDLPESRQFLARRIDEIANTEQWTGAKERRAQFERAHRYVDSLRTARPDLFQD